MNQTAIIPEPAPLEYQADVVRVHALADIEADFTKARQALFDQHWLRATAIETDFNNLSAAAFIERYVK